MGIGGYLFKNSNEKPKQIKVLRSGIEMGMTLIDTAEVYGDGLSEEIVGEAVLGIRDKAFIATKVSPENLAYTGVIKSAEGSLKRLKTDYIDLYQVHWPNPRILVNETMRAMEKLVEDGKIRYAGVCNFSRQELKTAMESFSVDTIVSNQMEYNLFDRSVEKNMLPFCDCENLILIAYSPLNQGRIVDNSTQTAALQEIASKYNKSMIQVVLNWLISHVSVVAIPKASTTEHIIENAGSTDFELDEDDIQKINTAFTPEIIYVPVDRIQVVTDGFGSRKVYQSIEEAIDNRLGFVPSPVDLAQDISKGEILKPVKIRKSKENTDKYDYDLIEGRIRYWAWVIAHKGKEPIAAYVSPD